MKGNKPDFQEAIPPAKAKPLYAYLVEKFPKCYKTDSVKDGGSGTMMKVSLVNDGPVTMQVDPPSLQDSGQSRTNLRSAKRNGPEEMLILSYVCKATCRALRSLVSMAYLNMCLLCLFKCF